MLEIPIATRLDRLGVGPTNRFELSWPMTKFGALTPVGGGIRHEVRLL
jgi:hypothetical protein